MVVKNTALLQTHNVPENLRTPKRSIICEEVIRKVINHSTSSNSQNILNITQIPKFVQAVHAPNEKDAMALACLDRKEVRHATWRVQCEDRPAGGNTGRLFLTFGRPVCADRFSILSIG